MLDYARASEFIGLKSGNGTPIELMDAIKRGIPVKALEKLAAALSGVKQTGPAYFHIVHGVVPKATYSRRVKSGVLSQREGEIVTRLAAVLSKAIEVFGDEETARSFLYRSHIMLEDRRPVDLILQSEIGADAVVDILGRLQYGSAA